MKFFRDAWPAVVIAATIAGAAWTAAWNVGDFLTAQIAASENRLAAQIAANENRIAAQIAASENRLAAQIAANENRIEDLARQMAELRQYFVDHLADHVGGGSTPSGGDPLPALPDSRQGAGQPASAPASASNATATDPRSVTEPE